MGSGWVKPPPPRPPPRPAAAAGPCCPAVGSATHRRRDAAEAAAEINLNLFSAISLPLRNARRQRMYHQMIACVERRLQHISPPLLWFRIAKQARRLDPKLKSRVSQTHL